MKQNTAFMITPEEAISMSSYNDIGTMRHAANVAHVCERDSTYRGNFLYATIYKAGVVDGIRRERARRKETAK